MAILIDWYQALATAIILFPFALLADLSIMSIITKLLHINLWDMIVGNKHKQGMYISLENYDEKGHSSGNITMSINQILEGGQLAFIMNENVTLKNEIATLRDKLKKSGLNAK